MSSPRDDGFYGSYGGKVRRSIPVTEGQSSGLFRTGQGGRPVLPPISSAFHQWPSNTPFRQHAMSMAPLARWSTSPFTLHMPFSDEIRSPTASYPSQYASHHISQQPSYPYLVTPSDTRNTHFPAASYNRHLTHMGPQSSAEWVIVSRGKEVHPHARSTATPQSVSYGAEPVAPTEEPVIKKKRKRADAAQLRVLNETYQRTAFPSTEERQTLATKLDMPPRSVQIWFQNKRQSERQSSRQLSTMATQQVDARGSTFNDVKRDQHNVHITINNNYTPNNNKTIDIPDDPNIDPELNKNPPLAPYGLDIVASATTLTTTNIAAAITLLISELAKR